MGGRRRTIGMQIGVKQILVDGGYGMGVLVFC